MTRIYSEKGEKPLINQNKVLEFFEERAEKAKANNVSYKQAVIYQDKNLKLAEERDKVEKELLIPKLALLGGERFLDVGCGTGRWVDVLQNKVAYYHGIDASNGLVKIAIEQFGRPNIKFTCLKAEDINLKALSENIRFDRIFNVGIMMYLNEPQLQQYLENIPALLFPNGIFIVREPIALEKRLTLDSYYSEDMEQAYSAIYRTEIELMDLMMESFDGKLNLVESNFVFNEKKLNHRAETKMKYFIFKSFNK